MRPKGLCSLDLGQRVEQRAKSIIMNSQNHQLKLTFMLQIAPRYCGCYKVLKLLTPEKTALKSQKTITNFS